jgi:ribosomal protein L27
MPGTNVDLGKDHSIFALKEGVVSYKDKRKGNFDGKTTVRKIVSVK